MKPAKLTFEMVTIYGIPNCNSVKKVRQWFEAHNIKAEFYDFRKQPISQDLIQNWCNQVGIDTLLNRKSTSWRNLDEATKNCCDNDNIDNAVDVMHQNITLIKRPVVVCNIGSHTQTIVGFKPEAYSQLFNLS